MLKNRLIKTNIQQAVKYLCPVCKKEDHIWLQVYAENNSRLTKMGEVHISWCELKSDYVLTTKNDI